MIELSRADDSSIALRLDEAEADLLRNLSRELRSLLVASEEDAVARRLFPDAYEREEDSRAYRELVDEELLRAKLDAVDRVTATLGSGDTTRPLSSEDVTAWLTTLTDMRLALGTRLDVDEAKMRADLDPNDGSSAPMAILHWLGWVQESILRFETDA